MDTKHPTYIKINNTFDRVMDEISKFQKVFQPGGKLEQAILEIDGDPSYLKDLATAFEEAYEVLQEAHYGTLGHVVDEQLSKKKKITPSTPVDMVAEGVLDGGDEDGFMARSQLYFLARDAIKLHGIVKDQDDLAPWVSSKIAQASKDMDSVRRYTEYNAMKAEIEPEAHAHEMPQEMPQEMNEGTMIGGLMKYDGQPEGEYADAVARYKEFMSQPRPPSEATTDMVQGFIFDDELLDSLGEAEDGGDVLDVRYIVQSRLEDFFGPDFELGESVYEAKQEMCPEACCGKPITECKCGPDCEHCDCYSKNSAMNEGMEFDEKRNDDLQVIAKDMFKNALANAKKKQKQSKVAEGVALSGVAPTSGNPHKDQTTISIPTPASKVDGPKKKQASKKSKRLRNPQNVIGNGDHVMASKEY
jgi:hypothetical protein